MNWTRWLIDTKGPDVSDYDDDDGPYWTWGDPDAPDAVRHGMASLDGILPCCGRRSESAPTGEWQTADPDRVNCPGQD
jgi:hypothetical protein